MDIGKLPTDNLYKFIAIGGLVLLLFGVGFTYTYMFQVEKLQLDQLNRIRQESINFGPLIAKEASTIRKMDYIEKIAKTKFGIKSLTFPDPSLTSTKLLDLKPLKYEFETLNIELESVRNEIETNKENLKFKTEGIQLEQGKILKDSIKYYLIALLGAGLFIIGLILWYFKTQRILDKKLKNESNYDKLFEYRYFALKEINLIYYRVQPRRIWEDMDDHEAYENVAFNQSQINNLLNTYLNKHSAILDSDELKALKELERISNNIQFEINQKAFSVSSHGIDLSKEVIKKLKSITDIMKSKFDKDYK